MINKCRKNSVLCCVVRWLVRVVYRCYNEYHHIPSITAPILRVSCLQNDVYYSRRYIYRNYMVIEFSNLSELCHTDIKKETQAIPKLTLSEGEQRSLFTHFCFFLIKISERSWKSKMNIEGSRELLIHSNP